MELLRLRCFFCGSVYIESLYIFLLTMSITKKQMNKMHNRNTGNGQNLNLECMEKTPTP